MKLIYSSNQVLSLQNLKENEEVQAQPAQILNEESQDVWL